MIIVKSPIYTCYYVYVCGRSPRYKMTLKRTLTNTERQNLQSFAERVRACEQTIQRLESQKRKSARHASDLERQRTLLPQLMATLRQKVVVYKNLGISSATLVRITRYGRSTLGLPGSASDAETSESDPASPSTAQSGEDDSDVGNDNNNDKDGDSAENNSSGDKAGDNDNGIRT